MIRKQIIFSVTEDISINYNYQYDVLKNIYNYLSIADDVNSRLLHSTGYKVDSGHVYKLFNFSVLFEGVEFHRDNIKLNKLCKIKLILSGKASIIKDILKGLLHTNKIKISDSEFLLENVIDDKRVSFGKIMLYKSLSPIVETTKDDFKNKVTLTPYHNDYYKNLAENAKRKYKIIHNKEYTGPFFFDIDDSLKIREKSIRFKNGSIKGYEFDIWVEADADMQKIIYYLGLGQNSSSGFGCLSFITRRDN